MWREDIPEHRTRPPQLRGVMDRPHLLQDMQATRLCVVQAPAGYGKTSVLYRLYHAQKCLWYTMDTDDLQPVHLIGAFALGLERLGLGDRLTHLLDEQAPISKLVDTLIGTLIQHGITLIIDEAQHLPESPLHGVMRKLLEQNRVVLGTRRPIHLPELVKARASGELGVISSNELSFSAAEFMTMLQQAQVQLSPAEVQLCLNVTEGWPIATRYLVQALSSGRVTPRTLEDLELRGAGLGELFAYVAQEVLEPLDPGLQSFLRRSSVFEVLTPEIMEEALEEPLSRTHLETLARSGTFLSRDASGAYHAHPLLRTHLRSTLSEEEQQQIAARGALAYEKRSRFRNALNAHLLSGNLERAAELLCEHGSRWLMEGRARLVGRALNLLSERFGAHPELHILQGDVLRHACRYPEAIAAYRQGPELEALLGEAQVYLDTVSPLHAVPLLEKVAHLPRNEAQEARFLTMQAENALNEGEVERPRRHIRHLTSPARLHLRSGQLREALHAATHASRDEKGLPRLASGHREGLLLSSLLHAFLGQTEEAEQCAREGIRESERLVSPFSLALAHARLGHALISAGKFEEARTAYLNSLEQGQVTVAPRLRIEAQMGLAHLDARLYGRGEEHAEKARAVLQDSGDRWMYALMHLIYAYGLHHASTQKSRQVLSEAAGAVRSLHDPFLQCLCDLLEYLQTPGPELAHRLLHNMESHDYSFLLLRPSLFYPFENSSERIQALILLKAHSPEHSLYLDHLAEQLGYSGLPDRHPGYTLRIELLGPLKVFRDQNPIEDWGRARARDLLALLVVSPEGITRDVAIETLYPEEAPEIAERNFRIVLHALGQTLESEDAKGYFLERSDVLKLKPSPDLKVDLWEAFRVLDSSCSPEALLNLPLNLSTQFDLAALEDQRVLYRTRLERALVQAGEQVLHQNPIQATTLAERALMLEKASEDATRLLMRCAHLQGQMDVLHRSYQRCEQALEDLGLRPSSQTRNLYVELNRALLH
ncbi:transcriptional regulator [Deinococcus cellulosilyticus]|uniref:Transcriptional activator n=1 Tax=Deinococcus cellulosilyticus (strain DSM 18568 / NBRC 106333 / KACC 11606 / 5516J-15) TaxID=1223518 RepID=A0A511N4A6_DEIC1|nr:transcriptional regulator [Deinococcus cellulosilyticus]GEM47298.1 transcriptional activator [Deinococcus cellulosilyticus NBRC 106333 = KACC 11606]